MRDIKNAPYLFVFAGANGSGKSTVIDFYLENNLCPQDYICPDQLVPYDKKNDVVEYIRAMNEAERRRKNNVTLKNSFTFETVLSTRNKLDFINVAQGGHDVPKDKIVSRYEKSMNLMFDVIESADEALIYDNSEKRPIVVFAKYRDKDYYILRPFPVWIKRYCKDERMLSKLK